MEPDPPHFVFLCTGNAARSVMATMMFEQLAPGRAKVTGAGTHVIEGQPMSWRTHKAIKRSGFEATKHRSHQLTSAEARSADLIVAMAGEHVGYIRREYPAAAARTATLKRLVKELDGTAGPLSQRVAALDLAAVAPEDWEDVTDPAGGHLADFEACADEIRELIVRLVAVLAF